MVDSQKTILIVDDEETLTWSMSKNLSLDNKYKVICANSGEEALDVLQKAGHVDLVVSDIKMQGKDGLQLLSEVKARYPKVGFIIMTAYGSNEKRQEALEKGAIRYIEKPFMMEQVKGVINEVLDEMERMFQPPDDGSKQKAQAGSPVLTQIIREKAAGVGQLVNVELVARDGDRLVKVKKGEAKEGLSPLFAAKAFNRIQAASDRIACGHLVETILLAENHTVVVRLLSDNLLLFVVFEESITLGRALLAVNQLQERITKALAKEGEL